MAHVFIIGSTKASDDQSVCHPHRRAQSKSRSRSLSATNYKLLVTGCVWQLADVNRTDPNPENQRSTLMPDRDAPSHRATKAANLVPTFRIHLLVSTTISTVVPRETPCQVFTPILSKVHNRTGLLGLGTSARKFLARPFTGLCPYERNPNPNTNRNTP